MRPPRVLGMAVAASLLVHGLALLMPGGPWFEDSPAEPPSPLSAHLAAAPAPSAAAPARPRKPAPRLPVAEATAAAPVAALPPDAQSSAPDTPASPVLAEASAAPAEASAAPAEPALDLAQWAGQGRVRYQSSYFGLAVSAEQTWSHDDAQFSASLRGSVAIKGELLRQESSGHIAGGRPVSEQFRETFNKSAYETTFDADGTRVHQLRRGDAREVPTGGYALDMLALMHFMGLQPRDTPNFDIFVVTFRGSLSRVTVVQMPPEDIDLPLGRVPARRFHAEGRGGALKIDIWLAVDWRNAPLRVRVADEGGTYDLKAEEVEIDGQRVATAPPPSSGE